MYNQRRCNNNTVRRRDEYRLIRLPGHETGRQLGPLSEQVLSFLVAGSSRWGEERSPTPLSAFLSPAQVVSPSPRRAYHPATCNNTAGRRRVCVNTRIVGYEHFPYSKSPKDLRHRVPYSSPKSYRKQLPYVATCTCPTVPCSQPVNN